VEPDPEMDQIMLVSRNLSLEAFADTIVPGEKRTPDDRAIAGVVEGPGAVVAGALELLEQPGGGLAPTLEALAWGLNDHAAEYAERHSLTLDDDVPPFVALSFADRTALVQELTQPDHPEKQLWVGLALFSNMAFDSAAHLSTPAAIEQQHPGLAFIGYFPPGQDGLYNFPESSYGRTRADLHPATTSTGSPE
jgi:hypothetical protein